jgi:hypothetical protein
LPEGGDQVRLTIRTLGLTLLDIELLPDDEADDDCSRDLSGGNLGSDRIEVGTTDQFMGFTNGREVE